MIGRRRVFLAGIVVFTAASVLCGAAWSPQVLVAARFRQGIGGAASSAVVLGMIVALFPEPAARAKAIGAFSFVQAAGGSIGSLTGGVLTAAASWHWIFLINVPIGLVVAVLATRVLDRDQGIGLRAGADVPGAALVTAALMLGVYTIVEVDGHGWGSPHTLGLGAVAVALLVAFLLRQARAATPLLPLRVFTSRSLSAGNAVQALLIAAMFGFQFLIVLYLRQVLGFSVEQTGFAMVPVAVLIAAISLGASARVTGRFGERAVLLAGLGLITVGLMLLARAPSDGRYVADVLPALALMGIGFGLAMPALMSLGMRDARPEDTGLASGLFNTTQQVAGALGLSVLGVLAATRSEGLAARGVAQAEALTAGYHLAFWIGAGLVAASAVLAAATLRPARR
ncbi:MFS transporter [Amycolatopsis sp. K13G38]|uniref:MFS transporter n=1 Tax=Amycolatopsis acididurans TaxID=2724524 RepID=A0ABX1J1B7_9PSEU|nr:MFS transporter [Amycolatopsis acididurans]NKQ52145.1 MFS transporter [Amycolatopsis acididurans]